MVKVGVWGKNFKTVRFKVLTPLGVTKRAWTPQCRRQNFTLITLGDLHGIARLIEVRWSMLARSSTTTLRLPPHCSRGSSAIDAWGPVNYSLTTDTSKMILIIWLQPLSMLARSSAAACLSNDSSISLERERESVCVCVCVCVRV